MVMDAFDGETNIKEENMEDPFELIKHGGSDYSVSVKCLNAEPNWWLRGKA
jgi:hypothetical protein